MDTLKQAGKVLHQSKKTTDFDVRRFSYNFPMVERTRDTFDSDNEFILEIILDREDNNVLLTIHFDNQFIPENYA